MSKANGSGNGRFDKYHEQVSKAAGCKTDDKGHVEKQDRLRFAPDFFGTLIRRIATGDYDEAVMEWLLYRANGNYSIRAVHIYSYDGETVIQTFLRQRDCALELAWLVARQRPEWLDAPLPMFRAEAKRLGIKPIDKSLISEAVAFNRARGTIARNTGYFLDLVPDPQVGDSTEDFGEDKEKNSTYETFAEQWNVAHSAEHERELVARSTIKEINKVRLSAYKEWKRSAAHQRSESPSLEALETPEASSEEATTPPPPVLQPDPQAHPVSHPEPTHQTAGAGTATAMAREPALEKLQQTDADFHRALCERFKAGTGRLPTPDQSAAAAARLGSRKGGFLQWLTPEELKLRGARGPGVLPGLVQEYLDGVSVSHDLEVVKVPGLPAMTRREAIKYLDGYSSSTDPNIKNWVAEQLARLGAGDGKP